MHRSNSKGAHNLVKEYKTTTKVTILQGVMRYKGDLDEKNLSPLREQARPSRKQIPTNSVGGFLFLHTSPVFIICRLLNYGQSDQCEVKSNCSFYLHLSNNFY